MLSADTLMPVSLRNLLWTRTCAKLGRLKERMLVPRRLIMNLIVLALGIFWCGQAVLGIFMRPPADPGRLTTWITSGLVLYAYWHLLRSVWSKDVEGIHWSRPERELLWTAPLSRVQLIAYRLAGMIGPAILKASLLTAVLIPDSSRLELTFLGLFLALTVLELTRMIVEVASWGLPKRKLRWLRMGISAIAVTMFLSIVASAAQRWTTYDLRFPIVQLPIMFRDGLIDLGDGPIAWLLGLPLRFIADVATSGGFTSTLFIGLFVAFAEVAGLVLFLIWIEQRMSQSRIDTERQQYDSLTPDQIHAKRCESAASRFVKRKRLAEVSHFQGAGSIIARHLETLKKYWTSVFVTLAIPGMLSMFPVMVLKIGANRGGIHSSVTDASVMLHVVGSLVFYTLLLGPAALKIDFRRDLDRLITLKQLPIRPMGVVAGQLAVPILCCLTLHAIVVTATSLVCSVQPLAILIAVAVLVPTTTFIFALENAIFLAFPQRIGQEGIEVLVRTTLVFVFKGLLFAIGVMFLFTWSAIAKSLFAPDLQSLVARIGNVTMLWVLAAFTIYMAAVQFKRFDLSADTPAA